MRHFPRIRHLLPLFFALSILPSCQDGGYSWERDLQYRISVDFCRSREEVKEHIRKYIPDVTEKQIDDWTASGKLEAMEIDSRTLYFKNAAPNLFRIDPSCKAIKDAVEGNPPYVPDGDDLADMKNLSEILASEEVFSAPKRMRIKYTLTVDADAVPEGEMIRCWLPYPRSDEDRQKEVKFIKAGAYSDELNTFSTSDKFSDLIHFSSPSCKHSTLYMEMPAVKGKPTVFTEEFEYTSYGEFNPDLENKVKPYDTSSDLYREFTSEREKHIIFTPEIKHLADSLTEGITNPYLQARAMFTWISDNIPWASAREYSTMENIPMYVLQNRHGDCGMKTLLLLTMCRYKGIPGHFQSGFMMHPGAWNLHDWGELYFEGVGWVPVDQSFGIPGYAEGEYLEKYPDSKYFFLGGIDSWRMVVNQDYGMDLDPKKSFTRSETVDFQRGEVEWRRGNLYFPEWDYDMEIEYL
ncbi:MAG: transglutaminase domain-containing protein [Bacteroidales bacterium]|nr:transglutaminase domain-containing protein [Bacteroidales bacterium]